ncbi:hypothetical protein CDAR_831 [Caerostris darwini]|uniref:Uncharacterized protein n=1 Tax=Caerostris darwini TaxID=1538125 RepID=A0AAV4QZ29_9ARAC|nr:hypothetical protein CDAR_831 [Caerostris darwini]
MKILATLSQSPDNRLGDHALNLPNSTEPTRQTRFDFHLNKSFVCNISSLDRWLLKSETHLEVRSRGFDSPPHPYNPGQPLEKSTVKSFLEEALGTELRNS